MRRFWMSLLAAAVLFCGSSQAAVAYIGPGAGLAAIGSVVALFGAVLLALVGFVWYPVKRLRAKLRQGKKDEAEKSGVSAS